MVLYNQSKEFVGISDDTLEFLGYKTFNEFRNEIDDISRFFVKKPGYIYRFNNFSWIDFALSRRDKENKAIFKIERLEFETVLKIDKVYLFADSIKDDFLYKIDFVNTNLLTGQEKEEKPKEIDYNIDIESAKKGDEILKGLNLEELQQKEEKPKEEDDLLAGLDLPSSQKSEESVSKPDDFDEIGGLDLDILGGEEPAKKAKKEDDFDEIGGLDLDILGGEEPVKEAKKEDDFDEIGGLDLDILGDEEPAKDAKKEDDFDEIGGLDLDILGDEEPAKEAKKEDDFDEIGGLDLDIFADEEPTKEVKKEDDFDELDILAEEPKDELDALDLDGLAEGLETKDVSDLLASEELNSKEDDLLASLGQSDDFDLDSLGAKDPIEDILSDDTDGGLDLDSLGIDEPKIEEPKALQIEEPKLEETFEEPALEIPTPPKQTAQVSVPDTPAPLKPKEEPERPQPMAISDSDFDIATTAQQLGLDVELISDFIADFIENVRGCMPKIKSGLIAANCKEIDEVSHRLKGVAYNLGLQTTGKVIEQLAKDCNAGVFNPIVVQQLENQLKKLSQVVAKEPQEIQESPKPIAKPEPVSKPVQPESVQEASKEVEEPLVVEEIAIEEESAPIESASSFSFDMAKVSDELGLPEDMLKEFIADFVEESVASIHIIEASLKSGNLSESFDELDKIKSLADNLRIDNISELLDGASSLDAPALRGVASKLVLAVKGIKELL